MNETIKDFKVGQTVYAKDHVKWKGPLRIVEIRGRLLGFDVINGGHGKERIYLLPEDLQPTQETERADLQAALERISAERDALKVRVRKLEEAVALLNCMVLSWERHSETSRKIVANALNKEKQDVRDAE